MNEGFERQASRLTETQTRLLRNLAADPGQVKAQAEESLAFWRREKERVRGATELYRATFPDDRKSTLGQLDLFLLEEMVLASGSADVDFVSELAAGFPITGALPSGGQGVPVEGGQRVHGKPGLGGPPPIEALQSRCRQLNQATVARAWSNAPQTSSDWTLA